MKISTGLAGEMSGSMGGITASHNRGGAYLRRRSIPVNPNTARQQSVKSSFGGLVQAWTNELTEAQRQAWRAYAAAVPRQDSLGNTITLTGQQWYIAANTPRLQAAIEFGTAFGIPLPRVDDGPTVLNTGEAPMDVTTFEGDFTTPPGTVTVSGDMSGAMSADGDVLLYVGQLVNAGVRFYKGPYQLAALSPVSAAATSYSFAALDIATLWFSDNVPVAGWDGLFVPLRLRTTFDDGRLSQTFEALVQFTDATP